MPQIHCVCLALACWLVAAGAPSSLLCCCCPCCSYWLVCAKHMFQTRLLLFARADVVPSISHISSGFEATGIGQ